MGQVVWPAIGGASGAKCGAVDPPVGDSLLFLMSVLSAVCARSSAVGSWSAMVVVPPGQCGFLGGVTIGRCGFLVGLLSAGWWGWHGVGLMLPCSGLVLIEGPGRCCL